MSVGKWIGRRLADVVTFLRDKPFIPCQIDWYGHNVEAIFATPEQRERVLAKTHTWYDVAALITAVSEQQDDFSDDCSDCGDNCCIATDSIGEWQDRD